MRDLKQSTSVSVKIGPFLDSADGNTVEGSLTISQADVRLSKNGGDFAPKNESTAASHDELGYYDCLLDTTDTDTLGHLRLAVHESGALAVWEDFHVLPANVWDSLYGADKLQVHVDEMTAGIITASVIADNAIDAGAIAADAITSTKIADNAITANKIAADAITNAKIADNAFAAEQFAADFLTSAKIADDAIASEHIATGAITADGLAADAAAEIADKVLGRQADGTDGDRNLGRLIRKGVNKGAIVGTTLTVYEEDDSTPAFTETIARSAVNAIVSSDPD